jgi:syntaxin 5
MSYYFNNDKSMHDDKDMTNPNNLTNTFVNLMGKSNSYFKGNSRSTSAPKSTYLSISQRVMSDIRAVEEKLQALQNMANQSSLFSNDDIQINQMIMTIKQNLSQTQNDMKTLSENNDLQYSKESEKLVKNIADNLTLRFFEATKQFQFALKTRTINMKNQQEKKLSLKSGNRVTKNTNQKAALFLHDPEAEISIHGTGVTQQQMDVDFLKKRSQSIQGIEKMLGEVATLFQRITNLVAVQEAMIDRIDNETINIEKNVSAGKKSLLKAYENMASTRSMIISVFFMLMVFSTMYIIGFL